MANLHILDQQGGGLTRIVAHIPVPNANNAAGFSYRTVLVRAGLGGTTVLPDGDGTGGTISAAEKSSVQAGALVERVATLDVTQGGTLTTGQQIQTFVNDWYSDLVNTVQADLQARLAQYGRAF